MDRRQFIKISGLINLSMAFSLSVKGKIIDLLDFDELYKLFQNPRSEARPFVRWWWNGNCVTNEGIVRQLQLLKEAGIGGVEVNPFGSKMDDKCNSLLWLSDDWIKALKFTSDKAKELGVITDMLGGTGWPFGGAVIEPGEASKGIMTAKKVLHGQGIFNIKISELINEPIFVASPERAVNGIANDWKKCNAKENLVTLHLINLQNTEYISGENLVNKIDENGEIKIEVKDNESVLYATFWKEGFKHVLGATPGDEGPRLNHLNEVAVNKYLNLISDKLNPAFNGSISNGLRAIFCDSLELGAEYWTDDLLEEFFRRRGYKVEPYLALIFEKKAVKKVLPYSEIIERATYDYVTTLIELVTERFLIPFTKWCHRQGVKSRIQAYGRPFVGLDGRMIPDIAEGELWFWLGSDNESKENICKDYVREKHDWIWAPVANKETSSGARLAGNNIISAECFTNLDPVFRISLDRMKQASDVLFVSGINSPVMHGLSYSPPNEPFPGWLTMGTFISERNTWWPYFKYWTNYISRLNSISQHCVPHSQIAFLGPEIKASDKLLDDSFWFPWHQREDNTGFPLQLLDLWKVFQQSGYPVDFLSEKVLQQTKNDNYSIVYQAHKFEVLFLVNIESIEPATAMKLVELIGKGVKIVCIGSIPFKSPGLFNAAANDVIIKSFNQTFQTSENCHHFDAPVTEYDFDWVTKVCKKLVLNPLIKINKPDEKLILTSFNHNDFDFFFFANNSRLKVQQIEVGLKLKNKTPYVWNPENGSKRLFETISSNNELIISLNPLESILIALENGITSNKSVIKNKFPEKSIELSGSWQLSLQRVDGYQANIEIHDLIDLSISDHPELKDFAGIIIYKKTINDFSENLTAIDLGMVNGVSELYINKKNMGVKWYGKHIYDLEIHELTSNTVDLEIHVTTVLYNYCKKLSETNPVVKSKINFYSGRPLEPIGIEGPVNLLYSNR